MSVYTLLPGVIYRVNSAVNPVETIEKADENTEGTLVVDLARGETYSNSAKIPNKVGDKYSETLAAGDYEVGVHIPEGTYSVQMIKSSISNFIVKDEANKIKYSRNLYTSDGIASIKFKNVHLFTGATVKIESNDGAILVSENAQMNSMNQREPNTVKETFTIETDSVAGIEFPEGTYDITLMSLEGEYGNGKKSSYNQQQTIYTLGIEAITYKNIEFPKGTNFELYDVAVVFTTSEFNTI